jgi:hypothetical protein
MIKSRLRYENDRGTPAPEYVNEPGERGKPAHPRPLSLPAWLDALPCGAVRWPPAYRTSSGTARFGAVLRVLYMME